MTFMGEVVKRPTLRDKEPSSVIHLIPNGSIVSTKVIASCGRAIQPIVVWSHDNWVISYIDRRDLCRPCWVS